MLLESLNGIERLECGLEGMRISLIFIQREHAGLPVQPIRHAQESDKDVPRDTVNVDAATRP